MLQTAVTSRSAPPFSDVPFAQGAIEELQSVGHDVVLGPFVFQWPVDRFFIPGRATRVRGWMLMPDGPFDRMHAYVNGEEFYTCEPGHRPDVGAAFPHIPNADRAMFTFEIPRRVARHGRIVVVGKRNDEPIGRMSFRFRDDLVRRFPTPPANLTLRVVGTADPRFFHAHGYKSYCELRDAVYRHWSGGPIPRLLDWGCGCGRLAMHWLRNRRVTEVHGCDIDAEGIAWCHANLRRGQFAVVPFSPPTRYPDNYFHAVIAFSVFTHLTAPKQHEWLAEMRRIMVPGGVFAASVEGSSAAWFRFGPPAHEMLKAGINDSCREPGMESVLNSDEYRRTYQTRDYTERVFSEYFDVLEYCERGIGNSQDLVVLRKRT